MTLTKASDRALRRNCTRCGKAGAELYWAKDDAPRTPGSNGFVMVDKTAATFAAAKGDTLADDTRHVCAAKDDAGIKPGDTLAVKDATPAPPAHIPGDDEEQQAMREAFPPVPAVNYSQGTPVVAAPGSEAAALQALRMLIGTPVVDRDEIMAIARSVIDGIVFPTRTVIVKDGVSRELEGEFHHKQLGDVVSAILAGEHVMMVGPAGTGKSTIAEEASDSLGLRSFSLSLSPQTPASQIVGYMQAAGEYVRTLFREAYENGGVFHFDEIDNAHPSVLAVVNAALANGHMAFPDGMVKRHADFRCVASANTYGRGATRAYVGRQAIDAATLDRFTVLTIDIDEALETALATASGAATVTVDKVLKFVRKLRKGAEDNGLNVILSPRASIGMCRLLHAGMDWDQAVDARVRRGLDDATWQKLNKA